MENLLSKHRIKFPEIRELYGYQLEVLKRLLQKKNTLAVIPTGGGKSLLYQLTALEFAGVTLVVSPLIALMKEQVEELNGRGIKAVALNSSISFEEQRSILRNLISFNYKLIYVSPERLQNPFFRASLIASAVKIEMIVVDESHCISQWGSGFRPDYSQIVEFHEFLTGHKIVPLLFCLTATLSSKARKDILREFNIKKENVVSSDVIRDNLKLNFIRVEKEKEKEQRLKDFLLKFMPRKTIAYLYSKRECEKYSELLSDDYTTDYYHAGLESEERGDAYTSFKDGTTQVLFATTAFGMGVNIPDIESVIQIQIPNSVEEYYQQAGRGWRKIPKKDCNCLALWSEVNFDRRAREIKSEKWNLASFDAGVTKLLGKIIQLGHVVNKDKSAIQNSDSNLQLLRYKLEKHNIIRTIGELNGTPLTIELKAPTDQWREIQKCANEGMDSFTFVSEELKLKIEGIIEHLYEQDLKNNIKKIPAMKKDVFIEILVSKISKKKREQIIDEMNVVVEYRLKQLEELKKLFESNDPIKRLRKALQ
jgi:ATP-dependent DNA helicase RecQ